MKVQWVSYSTRLQGPVCCSLWIWPLVEHDYDKANEEIYWRNKIGDKGLPCWSRLLIVCDLVECDYTKIYLEPHSLCKNLIYVVN